MSENELTVWPIYEIGTLPYQSKIIERNALLILKVYLQRADQPQPIFVNLTDTRPLDKDVFGKVGKRAYRVFVIHF